MNPVTSATGMPAISTQQALPQGLPIPPWGNHLPATSHLLASAGLPPLLAGIQTGHNGLPLATTQPLLLVSQAPPAGAMGNLPPPASSTGNLAPASSAGNAAPPAGMGGNQAPPPTFIAMQAEVRALDRKMDQILAALGAALPNPSGTTHAAAGLQTFTGPLLPTSFGHPPPSQAFAPPSAGIFGTAAAPSATAMGSLPQAPVGTGFTPTSFTSPFSGHGLLPSYSTQPPGVVAANPAPQQVFRGPIMHTGAMPMLPPHISSDEGDISGVPRSASGLPRRGRGRGRGTSGRGRRGTSSSVHSAHTSGDGDWVSTDDDDPDYEENRKTRENNQCRKLNISIFSSADKSMDFAIWVAQYEDAVKQQTKPHSKKRHWKQCLNWLPQSLKPDAYAIFQRAQNRSDWPKLRAELEEAFEDSDVRAEWRCNMRAYVWDEILPLREYKARVERYVDTFDKVIAESPAALQNLYYSRFVNGLPEDYNNFIVLGLNSKKADINKALEACLRFQSSKKKQTGKSEVGASASFNDTTVSARVTQNETGILRLEEKLRKMKEVPKEVTYADKEGADGFNSYNGRSPRFRKRGQQYGNSYSIRSSGQHSPSQAGAHSSSHSGSHNPSYSRGSHYRGRAGN